MVTEPLILHADMDAFYASVEQRDDPTLRGRPVVVGGLGRRGVVSAASYEARAFGVHSAMPTAIAQTLCPQAVFLVPRMSAYVEVSRQVFEIFESLTPLVEPLSLDEAFLDVAGSRRLFGDGEAMARRIKDEVSGQTGLRVSVGVATSKYVAKVASDLRKPDGLVVVPPGTEQSFLAPLPVSRLWGAGKRTVVRLERLGLRTIGDLQAQPEADLMRMLGPHAGRHFHALATAHDLRRVVPDRDSRSIGHESTFADDLVAATDCHRVLLRHAEGVGRRLRRAKLVAKTVRLKFRYPDFETHTRQVRLEMPTQDDLVIYGEARRLFDAARPGRRPMRLLGVSAADLEAEGSCRQLGLFDDPEAAGKSQRVLETMDRIRDRFGDGAISHGGKPKPSS